MKQNKAYNQLNAVDLQSKAFFSGGKFKWEKSGEEAWNEIEAAIGSRSVPHAVSVRVKSVIFAVAASLLILIGSGVFLRFYTTTVRTIAGEHQIAELPDGSTVQMNAESWVKYNPYWWRFKRNVIFEGEGFFKVKKGKTFNVISMNGTTQVLGTSFNIFSRGEVYKVTCLTGRVKVISKTYQQAVLRPNSKAEIKPDGQIDVQQNIDTYPEISWQKNIFLFTASPVQEVFCEIERQYGVTILAKIDTCTFYTGNFTREHNVEEVLGYICPALGLKYVKKSEKEYLITPESE